MARAKVILVDADVIAHFFKLKHDNGLLGDGECVCMAMARYGL